MLVVDTSKSSNNNGYDMYGGNNVYEIRKIE